MHVLDLDQLRTFVAIAEMGSFTAAGDAVHKTQSAVSMQMRRLEERVGRPIFIRDGRQSRVTEDGRRLLEYARRMIRLNDEALQAFSDPGMMGTIRLGLPDDYADRLLPTVLAGFSRINPMVEIAVDCQASTDVAALVREGRIDIGIVTRCDTLGIEVEPFRTEPLYWVGSREHDAHERNPIPLALGPSTCSWRRKAIASLDRIGRRFRVAYSSPSAAALSGAVIAGLAVTVMPESTLRPSMRILGSREGLPELPPCEIGLVRSDQATHPVHDALANHILTALSNMETRTAIAAE